MTEAQVKKAFEDLISHFGGNGAFTVLDKQEGCVHKTIYTVAQNQFTTSDEQTTKRIEDLEKELEVLKAEQA